MNNSNLTIFSTKFVLKKINLTYNNIINSSKYDYSIFSIEKILERTIFFKNINIPIYRSSLIDRIYKMKSRYIVDKFLCSNSYNYNHDYSSYNSFTSYSSYNSYNSFTSYSSYNSYSSFTSYSYCENYNDGNNCDECKEYDSIIQFFSRNIGYPKSKFIDNKNYKNYIQIKSMDISKEDFITGYGLELI